MQFDSKFPHIIMLTLTMLAATSFAQVSEDTMPEVNKELDFMIGEWTVEWGSETKTSKADIEAHYVLDGHAVEVSFMSEKPPSYANKKLVSRQYFVYDKKVKKWRSPYFDNTGDYQSASGSVIDNKLIMYFDSPSGKPTDRIVYHRITKNSYTWTWESLQKETGEWARSFDMRYSRKK